MEHTRVARPVDIDTIVRFNRALALETEGRTLDEDKVRAGVRALLEVPTRGFYLMAHSAEAEEEVLGQLMVTYEWSDWRNGTFWWIQSVYVTESARRRGVYRMLYAAVQKMAQEFGAVGLRLYVERNNAAAQATYAALGMQPTPYLLFEAELGRRP